MKSVSIQVVESIFTNPLSFLKLGTPQVYENMTIIPIIVQDDKFIDFVSIKEAEELGLIEIIETNAVNQLEVINKSDKQILIPFGMTVHGGKQDRTIWEPILLPVGSKQEIFNKKSENDHDRSHFMKQKYIIPAKCIEQSRWSYTKGHGFKSTRTRIHPNLAFEAISPSGQGAVWQEIQSHRAEMNYGFNIAPTQNYIEIAGVSEKYTERIIKNFNNIKNQCGIAVFINGNFIGIEFYANANAWKYMSNDVFKAFAIEALRFKHKPIKKGPIDFHDQIIGILQKFNFNFSTRDGMGIGDIVEFNSQDGKWRGITLVYNGTMAQFYLVSKRGGYQAHKSPPIQFQGTFNRRFFI